MSYMERGEEKRCDPQKVLPGARSIVVLAMNYFQGKPQAGNTPAAAGRIARYAWGDDYHDLIETSSTKSTSFFASSAGNRNVMSIPGQFWNAITRRRPASAGMARARC